MARPSHALVKLPLQTFEPLSTTRLTCGNASHIAYHTQPYSDHARWTVSPPMAVRRCNSPVCSRYHQLYRPEAGGAWALLHENMDWM